MSPKVESVQLGYSPVAPTLDASPEDLQLFLQEAHGVAAAGAAESSLEAALAANRAASASLQAAAEAGWSTFRIAAVIEPNSPGAAVRLLQVLSELSQWGKVVTSVPSQQEIEQEKGGSELQAIVITPQTADELRSAVGSLDDVQSVTVDPWRHLSEAGAAADEAPAVDDRQGELDSYGRFQCGQPPEGEENKRVIDLGPEARGKSQREQLEMAAEKIWTLQTVRIDVEQLDALMNMIGELAIDRTRIIQISRVLLSRYKEDELVQALGETSAHVVKVVNELHQDMMQVRMLPIGLLFSRFPRLVRDLSRNNGKNIEFVVEGQDTEIDRSVIEKIKDPLVHLIRNAVDHGIEPLETRQAAGKPDAGLIKLSARHDQGYIVITLEDDGAGIDAQRVKESAVRKGIVSAETAERMPDAESLELIFKAGVSTTKTTTEVSGRGVGMDIVMREVQALNGLVQVHTNVGVGTTFTLRLPLTLTNLSEERQYMDKLITEVLL